MFRVSQPGVGAQARAVASLEPPPARPTDRHDPDPRGAGASCACRGRVTHQLLPR
jgi:hypothetical protein